MDTQTQQAIVVPAERHYSVIEVAEMWNLSPDTIREIFEKEAGVLVIGDPNPRYKRRYRTLRIPQSVVARVHMRFSSKDSKR